MRFVKFVLYGLRFLGYLQVAKRLMCCLALTFSSVCVYSQSEGIEEESFSVLAGSSSVANSSPLDLNASVTLTYGSKYEQSKNIVNIVSLSLYEEISQFIPGNFTASVTVNIDYGSSSSSFNTLSGQVLTINYDKDGGTKYNAKHYITFLGAEYVKVTVVSITAPVVGTFDTKLALIVQNQMRSTRFYELGTGVYPTAFNWQIPAASPDELEVSWLWPQDAGHTHTQLEWSWVEHEMESEYMVNGVLNTDLLFRNNATRVDLPLGRMDYRIPLLYSGGGKVYFRIRAVTMKVAGSRSDGPWSTVQSQVFNGHEHLLNWQSSISFAEEGKQKSVVEYYDGSLRSRQTVTKDNVAKTTVVAETFYDGEGRPALQVLPAPTMSGVIAYTENLNRFNTQTSTENPDRYFDFTPSTLPTTMDPSTGAAYYYSGNNATGNVNTPNAEGYPYTLTRYTPDGTGRIMAQSGVGAAMRMGSNHEMKYFYGTAAQEELDGLFGTEVGTFTHYFKNMVKDANGQMSVSYVDMYGRTVATALAGSSPTNLTSIASNQPASTQMTRNLLDPTTNVIKNNSVESITTLLVPAATDYHFKYELTPGTLQLPPCPNPAPGTSVCYDCMYDLEISITDESGDGVPIVRKYNNVYASADVDCSTGAGEFKKEETGHTSTVSANVITFTEYNLLAGSYLVRKTLTINEASLKKHKEHYLTVGLCKTEQQLIDSIYTAMLAVSDCDDPVPTCTDCLTELGTEANYETQFLASIGNPNPVPADLLLEIKASYKAAKMHCDKLCAAEGTGSQLLSMKRSLMLSDMVPYSGQYAQATAHSPGQSDQTISTGEQQIYDKYNIFSTVNTSTQPFYKKPKKTDGGSDYYRTNLGVVDVTIHPVTPNDNHVKLNQTVSEDFYELFRYSWTEALLPHHPEYARLQYAEANLIESYNWMTTFTGVTTYAAAASAGYIFTSSASLTDPFYTVAPSLKADMVSKVTSSYQMGLSMWQIAYGEARCKTIVSDAHRKACYEQAPKVPPFSGLSADEQNRVWHLFKSLYSMERDVQLNGHIAAQVPFSDAQLLVNEKYLLHFPDNNNQLAQQFGDDWSWYPPGTNPNVSNLTGGSTMSAIYQNRCNSYVSEWRRVLESCPQLSTHPNKEAILTDITTKMIEVCKKGSDEANPFGASSVRPSTPQDGLPRSFEDVIFSVFAANSINITDLCNPYLIESPKAYGTATPLVGEVITVVDTCHCKRFDQVKSEVSAAGKDPTILDSLNSYLRARYGDSLTRSLYDSLVKKCPTLNVVACTDSIQRILVPSHTPLDCDCSWATDGNPPSGYYYMDCKVRHCKTTPSYFSLPAAEPLPRFLKCGESAAPKCIDCATLYTLTTEFKQKIPSPYNNGPKFTGTDLTDQDVKDNELFAKFLNYRTGLHYSWPMYAKALVDGGCDVLNSASATSYQSVICRDETPDIFVVEPACQRVYDMAIALAQQIYRQRVETLLANFEAAYKAMSFAAKDNEIFTVSYLPQEYHYTLYYYDLPGNLVKTVPPKGVVPNFTQQWLSDVKAAKAAGTLLVPPHTLVTNYRYNSLGAVVSQQSPDGGTSRFWYDKLGRLAISQNAKQASVDNYSYTIYDDIGRITQVGQTVGEQMTQEISQDPTQLDYWITWGGVNEQMTITVYDVPYGQTTQYPNGVLSPEILTQQNLRNRVSYTATRNSDLDTDPHYTATYYTYDIHGNVDTLVQDYLGISAMTTVGHRYKRIAYTYDLISGKVNTVSYQPGSGDAFYHKYSYDGENRPITVSTSRDRIFWDRDAAYQYYKHGPIARAELGQQRVQGVDYAYTIHGWLKGVNSTNLQPATDIGKDGYSTGSNSNVARDIVGFSLHYFDEASGSEQWQDYLPINGTPAFARPGTGMLTSLYNGNIGGIAINNAGLLKGASGTMNPDPMYYKYGYDQLNRLLSMQPYTGLNTNTNTWSPTILNAYKEDITYDPNGNILTYNRNGANLTGKPLQMDQLTYEYYPNTNRLKRVGDNTAYTSNYSEDIDNQVTTNYTYDAIGNLITDEEAGITGSGITWSVYGKILTINKSSGTISYSYDASGNRISKTANGIVTVYVRDASGNVMAVYEKPTGALKVLEHHIYGSSRLGLMGEFTTPASNITLLGGYGTALNNLYRRGERTYELTNHLGNVLATVSDKKIMVQGSGTTIDHYLADIISATDYAPFGMQMPGRNYSSPSYRYGFNGKENDNDVKGSGNQQDYGFRIYDPRLGKFLSVDPLTEDYPWFTPYQFAGNMPVWAIDIDGLEGNQQPNVSETKNVEDTRANAFKKIASILDQNLAGGEAANENKKNTLRAAVQVKVDQINTLQTQKADVFDRLLGAQDKMGEEAKVLLSSLNEYDAAISNSQRQLSFLTFQLYKASVEGGNVETYNKWVDTQLKLLNYSGSAMLTAASLIPTGGSSAGFFNSLMVTSVTGGGKQWLRFGVSYSKVGNTPTIGLRWGAGGQFSTTIGSATLRTLNETIRTKRLIPRYNTWWNEPGHLHIMKLPSKSFFKNVLTTNMRPFL